MLPITPIRFKQAREYVEGVEERRARLAREQALADGARQHAQKMEQWDQFNRNIPVLPGWPKASGPPSVPLPVETHGGEPFAVGREGVGGPDQQDSLGGTPAASVEDRLRAAVIEARLRAAVQSSGGNVSIPSNDDPGIRVMSAAERMTGIPIGSTELGPGGRKAIMDGIQNGDKQTTRLQAFTGNYANSGTFGLAPKLAALKYLLPGSEHTYAEGEQAYRDLLQQYKEDHPVSSFTGEAAGFVAPGGVVAKGIGTGVKGAGKLASAVTGVERVTSPTARFLGKVADAGTQGAGLAAAFGATVGAENDAMHQGLPSPDLQTRLNTGVAMAPMGATFGAAIPVLAPVVRPAARAAGGAVAQVLEKTGVKPGAVAEHNARVGADAARRAFERAGILNMDDLLKRAAKYGDKPVVAGELGQDPLSSLVSLVRAKGTTGEKAMAVLEERVAGMPGRMLKDIADETGMAPDEVFGTIEQMVKAGRERAAPLYEASEAAPFAETTNLERILKAPVIQGLLNRAGNRVGNQSVDQIGSEFSPMLGKRDPASTTYGTGQEPQRTVHELGKTMAGGNSAMPPIKVYDELKQLLDEEINRRLAVGEGIDDIEGVRKLLVRELDEISAEGADYLASAAGNKTQITAPRASPYALAREAGGDAPKILAGQKGGQRALSGAKLAQDVEREVASITGGELTAYQGGVIQNMVKLIENGSLTPRRIKTKAFMDKLNSVFGEPAAQGLLRKFGIEAELMTKGSRWNPNVGSVTSQALQGEPNKMGDDLARLAAAAMRGDKIGFLGHIANVLRRQGYSENQLNAMGDILLSSPDDAARAMFPKQTPTPGAIPPPIPPAGRVRENPTPVLPGQREQQAPSLASALAPLARDTAGGAAGATFGAMTTPEGEDPGRRAIGYGLATALLTHGAGKWMEPLPVARPQLNAFFGGGSPSMARKVTPDFPEPVGFKNGRPGRNPDERREAFDARDLILARNDRDGNYAATGMDLGMDPTEVNITPRVNQLIVRTRKDIERARKEGVLPQLAKAWNVTEDELTKFMERQQVTATAGRTEAALTRAVEIAEKAAKAGEQVSYAAIAERLRAAGHDMTEGSLKSLLSAARSGNTRGHAISSELQDRIRAALPARPAGRPTLESPPELGGAMTGGIGGAVLPVDMNNDGEISPEERMATIAAGAGVGAIAGNQARRMTIDASKSGSFGGALSRIKPHDTLDDFVPDATPEILNGIKQAYVEQGQTPPIFKLFRMPDGRVAAWRGDGDPRGGVSHAAAREVLGLGDTRLEHGTYKFGDNDFKALDWSNVSGNGPAPRSLERMMSKGAKDGRSPQDVILDATPEELVRDLRSINAVGPGDRVNDYSHRRKLATSGFHRESGGDIVWDTSGGEARLSMSQAPGGAADATFTIDGKTGFRQRAPLTTAEAKQTFEKVFSIVEREVLRRNEDGYIFGGASQAHNRLYSGAIQRLGAPQGFVAIVGKDTDGVWLVRSSIANDLIAEGKIRPGDYQIIPSKRGDKPVPEWRRLTGQFAIPGTAATATLSAAMGDKEKAPAKGRGPGLADAMAGY